MNCNCGKSSNESLIVGCFLCLLHLTSVTIHALYIRLSKLARSTNIFQPFITTLSLKSAAFTAMAILGVTKQESTLQSTFTNQVVLYYFLFLECLFILIANTDRPFFDGVTKYDFFRKNNKIQVILE